MLHSVCSSLLHKTGARKSWEWGFEGTPGGGERAAWSEATTHAVDIHTDHTNPDSVRALTLQLNIRPLDGPS